MFKIASALLALVLTLCGGAPARSQSACQYIAAGVVLTPAQWNSCFQSKLDVTQSVPLTTGNNVWTGQNYFEGGIPWCSLGPSPGLSVDASPLIANCNTTLTNFGGGEIRPEAGQTYCIQHNTTLGANVGIRAPGSAYSNTGTVLTSTGCTTPADTTIITFGTGGFSYNVSYQCYGYGATQPCVTTSSARLSFGFNRVNGGTIPLTVSTDSHVFDNRISLGYGSTSVSGSGYFDRNNLNQNYVTGCIPSPVSISSISALAATSYTTCNIVSFGGVLLQANSSFTSTGTVTIPNNTPVGGTVTDGSGSWGIIAPTTYYALTCTGFCIEGGDDHTGPFTAGVLLASASAQWASRGGNIFGNYFGQGILATNDIAVRSMGDHFATCVLTTCSGVLAQTSGTTVEVTNADMQQLAYGVQLLSGVNHIITNDIIGDASVDAIHVGNGVNATVLTNNQLGAYGGANAHSIVLDASSTNHVITGNVCVGATSGLTDNSGGTNYKPAGSNPGC